MIDLSDVLGKNLLVIAIFMTCCFVGGFLLSHAIKKRQQMERESQGTHLTEEQVQKVERAASEFSEQTSKLQRGFRRISESRDPLKAFIDALSERKDVVEHGRSQRENR